MNGWLNSVYLDVLCRPIGAGEVGFWSSRAGTGSEGRLGVAEDIVESHEARTDEIKGFYTAYLRRPADPGGLDFWTRLLESGDADKGVNNDHVPKSVEDNDDAIIVADILSSTEYFQDSQVLATFATIPTCM